MRFQATLFQLAAMFIVNMAAGALVDMTHYVDENGGTYPTNTKFRYENVHRGPWGIDKTVWLENEDFRTPSHFGTHVDAPSHFTKGEWTIDQVPIERFISPAVVVDYQERCKENPNEEIQVSDLEDWEAKNGPIPEGAIILAKSGWSKFYEDQEKYYGAVNHGPSNMSFPGVGVDAASWLVDNRKVYAVGTETMSIDQGNTTSFPTHRVLSAARILMIENVGLGIHKLPEKGAVVLTLPMKNRGASGAPVRMLAVHGQSVDMFSDLFVASAGEKFLGSQILLVMTIIVSVVKFY